jgi:hypothetical protein
MIAQRGMIALSFDPLENTNEIQQVRGTRRTWAHASGIDGRIKSP